MAVLTELDYQTTPMGCVVVSVIGDHDWLSDASVRCVVVIVRQSCGMCVTVTVSDWLSDACGVCGGDHQTHLWDVWSWLIITHLRFLCGAFWLRHSCGVCGGDWLSDTPVVFVWRFLITTFLWGLFVVVIDYQTHLCDVGCFLITTHLQDVWW